MHGSLLAPDIINGLLLFELPLNESQTNTLNDPLSSVNALHTSQTETSQSIPINLRSSYTKYEVRKSALKKKKEFDYTCTSNQVEYLLVLKC